MIRRVELRHLRYFVTVAEEKSVTRAASRLGVSQPPLSRQIRDLERELGVDLFDRSTTGVRLTEGGETFLAEARAVLGRADEAVESLGHFALGKRGKVRIGHASGVLTLDVFSRALRSFSRRHPHVSVDLREMTTQGILRGLRDRTLDIALVVPISPGDFEGLAVEHVAAYAVYVAVSRKHRFARLRTVPLRDLAREPILGRSRHEYPEAHAGTLKILAPYTRSPKIVEEYDSFASLIAGVEAGRGAAFIVRIRSLIAGKRLVLRPLKPAPPLMPVAVAYRPDGLSAAAAAFLAAASAARSKNFRSLGPIFSN
jgi:DNA-binding transcriptional LysR family regulator